MMKLNPKKFNFKKAFKVLGGLLLVNLIYLNIILPVALLTKQIYLIAASVVVICHKKNIDLNNITPQQLDEICNLAIDRVIEIFKTNGFRVVPGMGRIIGLSDTVIGYSLTGMYSAPLAIPGYCLYSFGLVRLITG